MTGQELIKMIRKDRQELWDLHQLFIQSGGEQGMECYNPDRLETLINESDIEIIKKGVANGVYISDIKDYIGE